MKKLLSIIIVFLTITSLHAQIDEAYFFENQLDLNTNISYPGQNNGHKFAYWHFSHDQLLNYFKTLEQESEQIKLIEIGRTYENRPLILAFISSKENLEKLEDIRKAHLNYILNKNQKLSEELKSIIWLGYGVHGNESSASNAAMLTAYYLLSNKNINVQETLKNSVIIIDPCMNPDGFNRAANWVNIHQSNQIIDDQNSIQFTESFPGGRTNHYWFDLNRDWLLAQHPESKARLKHYHLWKPSILTDHHEMGSNGTFFFQPGVPSRNNPLTPYQNYVLTKQIGTFHAKTLDKIGTHYYSEEGFDDFYYGKGSSYPDVNSSIGILFEQSRVNGQRVNNSHGTTTFKEAIRNQFKVSLSSIEAANQLKNELLKYQQSFYGIEEMSKKDKAKAYLFASKDKSTIYHFIKFLKRHQIKVLESLESNHTINQSKFNKGETFVVSLNQSQYRLIKSIFEPVKEYKDSIFYDVSTWNMPYAYNLESTSLDNIKNISTKEIYTIEKPIGKLIGDDTEIGYLFQWNNYFAPSALYKIQEEGIFTKAARKPFSTQIKNTFYDFSYGSIFIPINKQKYNKEELYQKISKICFENGIDLFAIEQGTNSGIDIGSSNLQPLKQQKTVMIIGDGISSRNAGELWHLFDDRYKIPITRININRFNRLKLFEYNTLVLADGSYDFSDREITKIKVWLDNGGTIIAIGKANNYLNKKGLIKLEFENKEKQNNNQRKRFDQMSDSWRANRLSGVILNAEADISHPVLYGYNSDHLPVYKQNTSKVKMSQNKFQTPLYIPKESLLSGHLNKINKQKVENSAYLICHPTGNGRVISFMENPNFRAYWWGTNKLVLNASIFRELIN